MSVDPVQDYIESREKQFKTISNGAMGIVILIIIFACLWVVLT